MIFHYSNKLELSVKYRVYFWWHTTENCTNCVFLNITVISGQLLTVDDLWTGTRQRILI